MLIPVIFIVALVVQAAHTLKGELNNGTVTVTIEDFDKVCESSGLIRHGAPKEVGEKYVFSLEDEEDSSSDPESLFRSVLEKLCPYVGYFPHKESTEKVKLITEKDTHRSEYHIDDKTTKAALSAAYSYISDTKNKSTDDLINSTSELTSTTESIIKSTYTSDKVITDTKLDSIPGKETESTVSTPKVKHHSSVVEEPAKIMENITTATTPDKTEVLILVKITKTDTETTETALADSFFKETTYSSIEATPTLFVIKNSTINNTVIFTTETTKTTSNNTSFEHKDDLFEEKENLSLVTPTVKPVTLKANSDSTISTTEGSTMKENTTSTTFIGKSMHERDILKHELNTDVSEIESTSTTVSTKKITKKDVTIPTSLSPKITDDVVVSEKDSESENTTEVNKLPVYTFGKDDNTSDYSTSLDSTQSSTKNMGYTSDKTELTTVETSTEQIKDSSEENINESLISYYNEHTGDELIVAEIITEYTSTKFDEDLKITTDSYETDKETTSEYYFESSEDTEVTTETTINDDEYKIKEKVTYEHDAIAVDKRRKIVVILFVSILLVLSLIWAIKFLYKRHKGSYVLPQEGDNAMELGDNSTENTAK